MKKSVLLIASSLLVATSFAQKKELKEIKKAIEKDNFSEAERLLESNKRVALSTQKSTAEYYYLKGELGIKKALAGKDVTTSLKEASEALAEARKIEKKTPAELESLTANVARLAADKGQEYYQKNDFKNAALAFEQVYRFSPKDTLFLYNAAEYATQAKESEMALQFFLELKDLKYDGAETLYTAKNKETGLVEKSVDKNTRDMKMKTGNYTNPSQEKVPSKKGEIIRKIAYLYVEQGNKEEALKAFAFARKNYPKDPELIIQEANVHYQLGDHAKFESLMREAAELQPENPYVQYNIGVMSLQQGKPAEARKFFQKTLKLAPDNADAALNYAFTYTEEANGLVDQMNALGNTAEDIKRYNELKDNKDNLFRLAAESLNEYVKNNAKNPNKEVLENLKNIYLAINDIENYKRVKNILDKK